MTSPLLRYHGGKFRLADWIVSHFPPHTTYVEPFGGGASVLLAKSRSKIEVYNDLDGDIVNLFRVVRERGQELAEAIYMTPFSREEFEAAYEEADDELERARRTLIRAQMGFGSAGATKGRTGFRGFDGSATAHPASAFAQKLPQTILDAMERLRGVVIENLDAFEIIQRYDSEETLFYLDPPYMFSTRSSVNSARKYYRYEMTDEKHVELLDLARNVRGKVVISGYANELYDEALKDWHRYSVAATACSAFGAVGRIECLWVSPKCGTSLF
jgi:DNA adenine methylase